MAKTLEELEKTACLYWPAKLALAAADASSLPVLLETQDKFLSILKSSDKSPDSWRHTLEKASTLSPNVFLKHLMVLSDIGGERLQRFSKDFNMLFPEGKMKFVWDGNVYDYTFAAKESRTWTNTRLNVEKSVLLSEKPLNEDMADVAMILLYGASIIENGNIPNEILEKCTIGQLLGKPSELDIFVKQRYLFVSRITGGSTANDMGHLCEIAVKEYLEEELPSAYIVGGHSVVGISHNERDLTTFDLVVTNAKSKKCCAIEISFQVTTNSVIERKSGLAKSRKELLNKLGHKVAYIIDGSGNFQRKNAIKTIFAYSDCTVNFSEVGFAELKTFITTYLK